MYVILNQNDQLCGYVKTKSDALNYISEFSDYGNRLRYIFLEEIE